MTPVVGVANGIAQQIGQGFSDHVRVNINKTVALGRHIHKGQRAIILLEKRLLHGNNTCHHCHHINAFWVELCLAVLKP